MDFLFVKCLKIDKKTNITFVLHLYYGSVKCIDFLPKKYKIKVYLNIYDKKKIAYF